MKRTSTKSQKKKYRQRAIERSVEKSSGTGRGYTVETICRQYGLSRQGYYKKKRNDLVREQEEERILREAKKIRQRLPKIGCRKVQYLLEKDGRKCGRDKLFELLGQNDMLIKRKKKYHNTTDSSNGENRYKNLIKQTETQRVNQVYLSDITYIRTRKGFRYLALVTDAYSRKIVGHSTAESITTELCIEAIEMAVKTSGGPIVGIIHHSDQGSQYCSNKYREQMQSYGIVQSMGSRGNPYENAKAERVIGTLKREYLLGQTFTDERYLSRMIEEAISSYNSVRPHLSLGYQTPDEVYYNGIGINTLQATPSVC